MEISDLVWRLFILLLPGVVTCLFVRYITTNKQFTPFYFIIYSAILGLGVFVVLESLYSLWHILKSIFISGYRINWKLNLSIWDSLLSKSNGFKSHELILAYFLALPFGLFIGYIIQHKLLNRFLQRIKLTSRFDEGDLWSYFLNTKELNWVIVRNDRNNITYYGCIHSYSEAKDQREIVLTDVDVYTTDTWAKLYSSEYIYLSLENNYFSIEKPPVEPNN